MNHKWKKITRRFDYIQTREEHTSIIVTPSKQHECVNCGLRKGYVESDKRTYAMGYYGRMELIYFTDKILSRSIIPFACGDFIGTNTGNKTKKDIGFFSKEDFLL